MQGYYDMHPSVVLHRPLALTGFMGAQTAQTAQALCALTGLPLEDLDRLVESRAGQSISHLVLKAGMDALRAAERDALDQALRRRPPAVIALGDGVLLDPDNLDRIRREATLVYLRAELPEAARRVRRQLDDKPGSLPHFMQRGAVVTELGLESLHAARADGYAAAVHTLDIDGRRPTQVARDLLALPGLFAD